MEEVFVVAIGAIILPVVRSVAIIAPDYIPARFASGVALIVAVFAIRHPVIIRYGLPGCLLTIGANCETIGTIPRAVNVNGLP